MCRLSQTEEGTDWWRCKLLSERGCRAAAEGRRVAPPARQRPWPGRRKEFVPATVPRAQEREREPRAFPVGRGGGGVAARHPTSSSSGSRPGREPGGGRQGSPREVGQPPTPSEHRSDPPRSPKGSRKPPRRPPRLKRPLQAQRGAWRIGQPSRGLPENPQRDRSEGSPGPTRGERGPLAFPFAGPPPPF